MFIGSKNLSNEEDAPAISLGLGEGSGFPNISVNAAVFMEPIYLEHSAWHEHVPFAFWLAGAHRPRTFVELGTHYGVSYFAFCQAIERLRLATRCYAVDSWQGDEHAGLYGGDVYDKVATHNARFYSRFSALMRTTFDEGAAFFADGEIDLLHIDGYHTFEAVKQDFQTWLPKLSERGLVILHDSNERKGDFGVYHFVEELRRTYPCFEFAHGHGLTIVGVGSDQVPQVRLLFEADRDEVERQNVQEVFARLGKACSDEYYAGRLRSEVAALSTERGRAVGEIERLGTLVTRTEAEARGLTRMVGERDNVNETVAAARDQLGRLTEENEALRRDARGAAETLKAVTQNNKALQEQLEQRVRDLAIFREGARAAAAASQRLALREQELRRIRRSVSWRMTAPIRAVTGASLSVSRKLKRAAQVVTFSAPRPIPPDPNLSHELVGFDREWYLETYPDVATSGMQPEEHYRAHGMDEGRHPSRDAAEFDREGYLSANPDVIVSGMDPFLHYCTHGKAEGRHFGRPGGRGASQPATEARQPSFLERRRYETSTPRGDKVRIPDSLHPVVSVIIPTYGQVEFTLRCLSSISAHPPQVPFEVIVMDDAFPGEEVARLKTEVEGIRLIRNPENQGFLHTCNIAAREASGKYLYFLNNDTEVFPGAIDALVDVLEADPTVGLTGSKLIFPDGKLQEAGGIIWSDATGWNFGRGSDPDRPEYNYRREVDYISGAAIMVRRDLFAQLEGFDPIYAPAYYEDTDLAFRIRQAGFKVVYEPQSAVVHYEGVSHGTDVNTGVKAHQVKNAERMLERWRDVLQRDHFDGPADLFRAKDRARHKPVILVVDHYVPEPDRDAGSRVIVSFLTALVSAGWVVKLWPHNRSYSELYTRPLEDLGVEVLDHRYLGSFEDWVRLNGPFLDHVLVSRPSIAADVLPSLRAFTRAQLCFYGVDIHFLRMRRQAEIAGNPQLLNEAAAMERAERQLWRQFDKVIYLSHVETALVEELEPETDARVVVPFQFDHFNERNKPTEGNTILFVAGFSHPPNVDAAEFLVREIMPLVHERRPDARLAIVGSHPTDAVRALAAANIEVTGWVSDERLKRYYAEARLAVVPLRFGAGVKGKVVEALNQGLPLVTTPIGAEGIAGVTEVALVRDGARDIADGIFTLLNDDDAWMKVSNDQVRFAKENFSLQSLQKSLLAALRS